MAEGVVSFLLPKLTTLLKQEYELNESLRTDVQYIIDELGSMRAFLRDAEAKKDADVLDDVQKERFKQVMAVAFDAEDVVDEYLLRFANDNGGGCHGGLVRNMFGDGCHDFVLYMYTSIMNILPRHQISSKIRDIKNRVKDISERYERYKSNEGISDEPPVRAHPIREADLVGIDGPKGKIIRLILRNESRLKTISVYGKGGLGKTTLVKKVYDATVVKREFSIHAWLTISQTFKIKDALIDFIRQLFKEVKQPFPHEEVDPMNTDGLREFVNNFLKDKRYIIVLDDLWKLNHWDSIKYVFPDDNCGSRIIITTRIKDVATICCHDFRGNVYPMQELSPGDSWKLFCNKTFGEGGCPSHLVDISRRILSKCEGLPLGIVAIGGLLALKDTSKPGEWETVLRSLGDELEGNGELDRVRKILLLSYNDLPYYLKCCLLYMGMFPEDAIVNRFELTLLWMAEGFVEVSQGKTAIEVAESYLNDLIGRSLIHVVNTLIDGSPYRCRVHDLTYKIILSKCKEYNMLPAAFKPNTVQLENVRRLGVVESNFPKEPARLLRLRSIILSRESSKSISDSSLSKLLEGTSKLLKVLYLDSSNLNNVPDAVFKLSNLTYLDLSNTNVTNIPESIRMLQNLEWLFLEGTKVTRLPDDIIILKKLYCLMLGGEEISPGNLLVSGCKAPYGLSALSSLRVLRYIEADSEGVIREIGKLTQLRELGITKITRALGRELCSSLEKLTNLQVLYIQTITRNEIIDLEYSLFSTHQFLHTLSLVGSLVKIPKWVPSCHGLSEVHLYHSSLRENPLGCLEGMPNLAYLRLDDAYTGDTLHFNAGGFRKLKALQLGSFSGLKLIRFEKGALPDLKTLTVSWCKLMEELPQDIQYLSKLQTLDLANMPTRLGNSLRNLNKESDGYRKISHISEIKIQNYVNGKWEEEYLKW